MTHRLIWTLFLWPQWHDFLIRSDAEVWLDWLRWFDPDAEIVTLGDVE